MWDTTATPVEQEFLPVLDVFPPGRQRRLTVFFRLLLLIPQLIVLWALSVAAFVVAIIGWFGALFTAHLPEFAARYLTVYLGYDTRVYASLMLLIDRYPPFQLEPPEYPARIEVRPGRLNRLAVFFRLILAFPATIIQAIAQAGWWTAAFFCWLVVLIAGRCPVPLFEATAAVLRYRVRYQAYLLMLSSAYPKRLFGDAPEAVPPTSATRPLLIGNGGRALLIIFLVLGLAAEIGGSVGGNSGHDSNANPAVQVSHPLRPF